MTQKRGLGRGLGALIPGAGSTPAPEQELRTRTSPSDASEGRSSSPRPVDMFFSGEKIGETARPQRGGAGAHDLAAGMARAAAERRGRANGSGAARSAAASASSGGADAETHREPTPTPAPTQSTRSTSTDGTAKKAPAKKAPAKRAAAKSTAAQSASAEQTAPKATASKSTASKGAESKSVVGTSAGSKSSSAEKTPAVPTAAAPASSTSEDQQPVDVTPAASREELRQSEDSPVVDVETVPSTPAQPEAPGADPEPQEAPAQQDDAAVAAEEPPATEAPAETPATPTEDPQEAAAGPAERAQQDESSSDDAPAGPSGTRGLVSVPGAEFAEIPIHEVRENPRNPRTMFDDDELDELAYSLREVGVLQPVVVRPIPVTADGESFELVMGERRWRAARRAGLVAIPAIIRETSDDDLLRDALLENLHRTQLNPLEEANAYQQLLEDFGCTQDELGERIGRSRPQITNTLRLLRLPALVQRRLASGAISAGHARALLSLDNPTLMEELAQRIVQEGLSVRAVERLVARGGQETGTRTVRRTTYDPHVVDLTSRLSNRLEAPVRIDVGKRKGRITLEFSTLEDLERLVENMGLDLPLPEGEQGFQA